MTMRKRAGRVLFTAAAAAAVVGMSVAPALAATSLTVKVSGGGSYTAKAGTTVLTDGTGMTAISVTCKSSKGSGKLASHTYHGRAPLKIGTVAKLSFSSCSGPLGQVLTTVHGKPVLNADSKTNRKGQTDAYISGVNVSVSIPAAGCTFTVTGSAPGFFSNKTHTLTTSPKLPVKPIKRAQLTIGNVSGCAGAVHNGDHPTYTATYKVSLKRLMITSR
jgi:hypothetical protein